MASIFAACPESRCIALLDLCSRSIPYSGSIIDNVRLFNKEISRQDVIAACKFVGADKWIERLKDGYDTPLSERGSGLSAGERQLLSFARILVYQPRILILDEATANLDSHTEQLIQRALQVVSEGRTDARDCAQDCRPSSTLIASSL